MHKILSFDGGGVRGAMSARLLERIVGEFPSLLDGVDLLAGTSTGGIIALALAAGVSPADILALYERRAGKIFGARDWMDKISPDEVWRADFDNKGLKEELRSLFGDMTLKDLKKRVLIPAFHLETYAPVFHDSNSEAFKDTLVEDVALRTSAAPTYFPSYQGFVDGGVCANNPVDCAIAALQNDGIDDSEIVALSIGTGFNPRDVKGGDWGLQQWGTTIIPLVMEGPVACANYRAKRTIGDKFYRLDVPLKHVIDLADVKAVPVLKNYANAVFLSPTVLWLGKWWKAPAV